MTKRILILVAALALSACEHDAVTSSTSENGVKVELLFEHEGVRVYRFRDGRTHYYAVPRNGVGASTFATWSEQAGKTRRTVIDEVPTVAVR